MCLTMDHTATGNDLGNEIKRGILDNKEKFLNFINVLNLEENKYFYDTLPSNVKNCLGLLEKMWEKNDDIEVQHYFDMKDHHFYITGYVLNKDNLKDLWSDYINSGMDLRIKLLQLVDLTSNVSRSLY
jgi:hypothetical protein